ncbi:MAG: hypothetical protein PVJ67_04115 [Candidatus Pacearchaeota archaeon]|jgi:hypothetical protein
MGNKYDKAIEVLNWRLYALKEKVARIENYAPEYGQDLSKEILEIKELKSAIKILEREGK